MWVASLATEPYRSAAIFPRVNKKRDVVPLGKKNSGMHKIVSEAQMSQPAFWFWYKKIVMPKKKLFVPRNLKDCLPNLPLKRGKQKRNAMRSLSFFYRDNFVLAWKMGFFRCSRLVRGNGDFRPKHRYGGYGRAHRELSSV